MKGAAAPGRYDSSESLQEGGRRRRAMSASDMDYIKAIWMLNVQRDATSDDDCTKTGVVLLGGCKMSGFDS